VTNLDATSVWHNDGHIMHLELNRAEVVVTIVTCPGEGECLHERLGCIVQYFINRFGLDCNVGVCEPAGEMPVAWMIAGDPYDVDACQVWVIPTTDEAFAAWLITQA
jgi:hypothetical protein